MVESLERKIDLYIEEVLLLECFILLGGSEVVVIIYIVCIVVRRVECFIVLL